MLQVQKKDGRIEDFDKSKIVNVLERIEIGPDEAQKVADQVEVWVQTTAAGGAISTSAIRSKVLALISPEAVKAYEEFESKK
jgi:transcriptional regulator NrdR family protein